ncbi:hypothetical protein BGZ58_001704 [Dissophora ornata]|nr:hypothetical protein BGZ58_001704 [Dissophora ornata]
MCSSPFRGREFGLPSVSFASHDKRMGYADQVARHSTIHTTVCVEVKKVTQGLVVQSDLEKLACEMKYSIDDLAKQKIDISSVRVFGMEVVGSEM